MLDVLEEEGTAHYDIEVCESKMEEPKRAPIQATALVQTDPLPKPCTYSEAAVQACPEDPNVFNAAQREWIAKKLNKYRKLEGCGGRAPESPYAARPQRSRKLLLS